MSIPSNNLIDKKKLFNFFLATLIFSGVSSALFEVASLRANLPTLSEGEEPSLWDHWAFSFTLFASLEFIRAALILSNIFIREIDESLSKWFLGFAVVITTGIGIKIFFQTGGVSSAIFWTLETINVAILFSEYSLSVNIAGIKFDWKIYFRVLQDPKAFDLIDWKNIPRPLAYPLTKIYEIADALHDKAERSEQYFSVIERIAGGGSLAEADILEIERKISVGEIASDAWVYIDDSSGYMILCGGKDGLPPCKPFNVPRSRKSERCPGCGKEHDRAAFRTRLTEAA